MIITHPQEVSNYSNVIAEPVWLKQIEKDVRKAKQAPIKPDEGGWAELKRQLLLVGQNAVHYNTHMEQLPGVDAEQRQVHRELVEAGRKFMARVEEVMRPGSTVMKQWDREVAQMLQG